MVEFGFEVFQLFVNHELNGCMGSKKKRRKKTAVHRLDTFFTNDTHDCVHNTLIRNITRHLAKSYNNIDIYQTKTILQLQSSL